MTDKDSLYWIQDFAEKLRNDPVRLKKFMRDILGPDRRILTGEEYNHILLIMGLTEPTSSSNNQRTWTDEYQIDGRRYDITYGITDGPEIAEILEDDTTS